MANDETKAVLDDMSVAAVRLMLERSRMMVSPTSNKRSQGRG